MNYEKEIVNIEQLRELLLKTNKFDIKTFKEQFLIRRIIYAMNIAKVENIEKYYDYLLENPNEINKLIDILAINVSYFFRNENVFNFIKEYLIVEAWEKKNKINIWSMGCASGEEPYTVGMILDDLRLLNGNRMVKIYGSDIDEEALQKAKKAIYTKEQLEKVPIKYLKYFSEISDGKYIVQNKIKQLVSFKKENLLEKKRLYSNFDMILCRNLLIFLDKTSQEKIFELINSALMPNGVLVLEITENLPKAYMQGWQIISGKHKIYKKLK